MPELIKAPFSTSRGRPNIVSQSVTTMLPVRCPPDEWPAT